MERIKSTVTLDTFVGQEQAVQNIKMLVGSATEQTMPPHMLLIGDSGCGKTTLSRATADAISEHIDKPIAFVEAPTGKTLASPQILRLQLARAGDKSTVFFLDEVHQMKDDVQESLYEPMSDGSLTTFVGTRVTLVLPPICIIAATTEPGKLLKPFSNRFQHISLEGYTEQNIKDMAMQTEISDGLIVEDGAEALARRSKLNPRLLFENIDKCIAYGNKIETNVIDKDIVDKTLDSWGIDQWGFTPLDRRYLSYLYACLSAQGINNIAGMIGSDTRYVEENVEPYMIQKGIVQRTKAGRALTPEGIRTVAIMEEQNANHV